MVSKINADTSDGLKITSDTSGTVDIQSAGTTKMTVGTTIDIQGNELVLDADADTSIHASTDDQIDLKIGGTDQVQFFGNGQILFGKTTNDEKCLRKIKRHRIGGKLKAHITTQLTLTKNADGVFWFNLFFYPLILQVIANRSRRCRVLPTPIKNIRTQTTDNTAHSSPNSKFPVASIGIFFGCFVTFAWLIAIMSKTGCR